MSNKYLDSTGLAYFWTKIKDYVDSHASGGGEPEVQNVLIGTDTTAQSGTDYEIRTAVTALGWNVISGGYLKLKETLAKILSWEGLRFTWDVNTLNTTDSWIPVLHTGTIQHRVLPADGQASPTITNYNVWDSTGTGTVVLIRRGDVCTLKFSGVKLRSVSTRTDFLTVPAGYRPVTETGMPFDGTNTWFYVRPTGTVAVNPTAATTVWGACTYLVQK